ncbi:MAG: DUF4430 domain-containing protein [Ruminococcaceae bacterium]|nr:DUF4430 domain-containing protein [Oscillospiraceae bacterium]
MKMFKKSMSILLVIMMLASSFALCSFAADDVTVSLRIEGIDKCLFYGDVTVAADSTVLDVIKAADEAEESLTTTIVDSDYGPYLVDINGIVAGTYTDMMWDGWSYMVDGVAPDVGVSAYRVESDDVIVMYYGDPWNTGMQYPIINTEKLADGEISFTSMDTVYDENWNAVTKECAVTGYVLTWGYNGKTVEITPDENGVCKIPYKYLTMGKHTVQIEKYDAKTDLPTVLRYAPDFYVEISFFDGIMAFFKMIFEAITSLFA